MPAKTHGLSRNPDGSRTYLYQAWSAIKQRCLNTKSQQYPLYGGRGITVCQEWADSFDAFRLHVGERPSSAHSIDRVDNSRGYEPGNVRWATKSEQLHNQRDRKRVLKKTDALLLTLGPKLSDLGFSMRRIAALFDVGKTTVEKVLRGDFDSAEIEGGRAYVLEKRRANHPVVVRRIRRG